MSARACPVCGKPQDTAYRPFCSKRCADVDLQRWLAGVHRLEASEDEDPPLATGDFDPEE